MDSSLEVISKPVSSVKDAKELSAAEKTDEVIAAGRPVGDEPSPVIAKFSVPVRFMGGGLQHVPMNGEALVSDIKELLAKDLPDFHSIHLYVNGVELCDGEIAKAGLTTGTEVQAVLSGSIDMAILALLDYVNADKKQEAMAALDYLDQIEGCFFDKEHEKIVEWIDLDRVFNIPLDKAWRCDFVGKLLLLQGRVGGIGMAEKLEYKKEEGRGVEGLEILITAAIENIKARHGSTASEDKPPAALPDNRRELDTPGAQLSHDLENAIRASTAEALAREGAEVQEALLRSKVDAAQRQQLLILRLTKRNEQVLDALLKDSEMQMVQAQVEEAGCEVLPDWADGAVILAPLTEHQANEAEVKLRPHHIVVSQQDKHQVERVLAALPKRRRPNVQVADPDFLGFDRPSTSTAVSATQHDVSDNDTLFEIPKLDEWDGLWHVERTFVHCPLVASASDCLRGTASEP